MGLMQLKVDNSGKIKSIDGVVVNAVPIGEPFLFADKHDVNFGEELTTRINYLKKEANAYTKGSDYRDRFCAVQLYKVLSY